MQAIFLVREAFVLMLEAWAGNKVGMSVGRYCVTSPPNI